jgi:glutamate-ammonia-ligase adenylyltransferase
VGTELLLKGFSQPEKAGQNLKAIDAILSNLEPAAADIIIQLSANSFDPDRALNNFERFLVSANDPTLFNALFSDAERNIRALSFLFSGSQYLSDILIKTPSYIPWLLSHRILKKSRFKDEMYDDLSEILSKAANHKEKLNTLRWFRNREFLRIGLRDLMREADTIETIEDLSNVADICLQKTYEHCNQELIDKYGAPYFDDIDGSKKPCEFVILGMGKQGGRELNFSSDIDIMYMYSSDKGMTEGIEMPDGKIGNQITTHEYYVQLSRMITQMISEITDEGYVFRIDLDLRPEGKSGDITNSLRSAEIYYESWGETWERQALLKCRPIAGSISLGRKFMEMIRPFIFRKYLDFSALREIKEMKDKINRGLKLKRNGKNNVKLGYGGIREIEFIIQSFQLIYGGREKWLRERNSMRALHRISEKGLLSYAEYFSLSNAYLFLRDLENRIQLSSGRQTHEIPEDLKEQMVLSRKMGNRQSAELMTLYSLHTDNVRKIYDNLFSRDIYDISEMREGESQWRIDIDDPVSSIAVLKELGFKTPEKTRRNLLLMRDGGAFAHPTVRSKRYFNQMLSAFLMECANLPDPDLTVNNFEKFVDAGRVRESIYSVMAGNIEVIKKLCPIFGISQYLSNILIHQPELIDSFLMVENIYQGSTKERLKEGLSDILKSSDTYEVSLDELCKFKRGEELRIGLRDILGIAEPSDVMNELSNLADVYVEFSLKLAEDDLVKRYGTPLQCFHGGEENIISRGPQGSGFAIIGLGKLGGRELSFGSDLDIIFVYSGDGETTGTARDNSKISNYLFFSKLCEKLIYAIGGITRFGFAYRVDTRLRPDGEKGPLIMALKGYENYYQKRGEGWERLALIKSRFIAGDEIVGRELIHIIHTFVYDTPFEPSLAGEIHKMRKRMESERIRRDEDNRDIKFGIGGIVDIEFIIQLLQLKYGGSIKELRGTGSLETLKLLSREKLISEEDYQILSKCYLFLRGIEGRLRVEHDRPVTAIPGSKDELSLLAKKLGYKDNRDSAGDKFYKDLKSNTEYVREVYNRMFGID